jgi:hypothetical protein
MLKIASAGICRFFSVFLMLSVFSRFLHRFRRFQPFFTGSAAFSHLPP